MSHPFEDSADAERIRLIELDLSITNEFVRGVIGTGTAVRGVAVTVWLALLGVALQQHQAAIAALAFAVSVIFWIVDGYYGWLYKEATIHARVCETILAEYYNAISRAVDDPTVADRFQARLRSEHFGLFRGFRAGYGPKQWWQARPALLYRVVYMGLLAVSAAVALLLTTGVLSAATPEDNPRSTGSCVHDHPAP